eukprot:7559059-Pyramimonas_sp.AAC.1
MASIFSLFIINKSGGLIFQKVLSIQHAHPTFFGKRELLKDFTETARVDTNEAMTQASVWYGHDPNYGECLGTLVGERFDTKGEDNPTRPTEP